MAVPAALVEDIMHNGVDIRLLVSERSLMF